MRNFISKYRKILCVLTVIIVAAIITVTTIGVVNSVSAGVYKGETDRAKEPKGEGNEIVILEIVSEYGQQVLGYTIPGYEPITKEAIEAYPTNGPANLSSNEFKNATGWTVEKTSSGYVVNENNSPLHDVFSKNVFGDALNTATDVKVIVKQANDVTISDIDMCDLIYVNNPNDNDKNLMYYYDQVMNYNAETGKFASNYEKGDRGVYYDQNTYETVVASELAIRLIKNATGRETALELETKITEYFEKVGIVNTKSIFEVAGMTNYKDYNAIEYLKALSKLEKGSISEAVDIQTLLETTNSQFQEEAIKIIKDSVGTAQFIADMDDPEKKEAFRTVIKQANLVDSTSGESIYVDANFDNYVERMKISPEGGYSSGRVTITSAFGNVNSEQRAASYEVIKDNELKNVDELKEVVTATVLEKFNSKLFKSYNYDAYIAELSKVAVEDEKSLDGMFATVNETKRSDARMLLADAAGNEGAIALLTADVFLAAELEKYDVDLYGKYAEELKSVEPGRFTTEIDVTPVYEEKATEDIVLHFRAFEDITGVTVSGKAIKADTTEVEIPSTVMELEKYSNNYYRVVIDMPEGEIQFTEMQLAFAVVDQANPKAITVGADATGVFAEEYWCVFNELETGIAYKTNAEVVADLAYGETYNYGDFVISVASEEELNQFIEAVNDKYAYLEAEISYDFSSWDVSKALFEYAESEKGLIFSAQICEKMGALTISGNNLTSSNTVLDSQDNNLYKALLIITGRQNDSVASDVMDKISNEGVYYTGGVGVGTGVSKWTLSTFKKGVTVPISSIYKRTYIYNSSYVKFNGATFNEAPYTITTKNILNTSGWNLIVDQSKNGKTLGDIIRYVMNMYINELQYYPMKVLEIQPIAMSGTLDSYDGAKKLANWLRIDASEMTSSNWQKYFDVTAIGVREFNTQSKDLTSEYDLIYFGSNSSTMKTDKSWKTSDGRYRTTYNNTDLNGCIYFGVGDRFSSFGKIAVGVVPADIVQTTKTYSTSWNTSTYKTGVFAKYKPSNDYAIWKKYFGPIFEGEKDSNGKKIQVNKYTYMAVNSTTDVYAGAYDITVKKFDELIEYLKAGYPILMDDEIINCDTSAYIAYKSGNTQYDKWRYVHPESKMYNFVKEAKLLGYDSTTGKFTGKDAEGNDVFADSFTYPSLVNVDYARYGANPENLSAADKFKGGLSFATKRNYQVEFQYKSGPTEYDSKIDGTKGIGTTIKYGTTEYKRYKVVLNVPSNVSMEWVENNYTFQMYVDKSGLGRFVEENTVGLDPVVDFNYKTNQVILEGNWPSGNDGNMEGFIPWRVEAYRNDNPKNHYLYTGFSAFQKVDEEGNPYERVIEVLWLKEESNSNTFDFAAQVAKYEGNGDEKKDMIPEYDINVTTVGYTSFSNDYWSLTDDNKIYNSTNTKLKVGVFNSGMSTTDERYNKEFDMIVFGYADTYGGVVDIWNVNAHKNLKYFVESGHSLLFAHDNTGYSSAMLNYGSSSGTKINNVYVPTWGRHNSAFMRGYLGMDQYGVLSVFDFSEADQKDINSPLNPDGPNFDKAIYNARKYIKLDTAADQSKLRALTEGIVYVNKSSKFLYELSKENLSGWFDKTRKVKLVNEGQVSTYPFVLGKEINGGKMVDKNVLSVAQTHFQYFTLNLEHDDLQVWYTLHEDDVQDYYGTTAGDGANNYYIYTKGNVTYTGAGHSKISGDDEIRLFMNTVVAAIKVGNYAPEIAFTDADKNSEGESIIYSYDTDQSITINFKVSDYDSKKGEVGVFSDVKIFFDKIGGDVNDDANIELGPDDYQINAETGDTTDYMLSPDLSEHINLNESNIRNRVEESFALKYIDLANLYSTLTDEADYKNAVYVDNGDGTFTKNGVVVPYRDIQDAVKKLFSEYKLVIQATDIPKNTVSDDTEQEGITSTAIANMGFRKMFNLN